MIIKINKIFTNFLKKEPLFSDKKSLQATYTPEEIPHREKQIEEVANILAPAIRLEKPSNVFIYGKTGTGKTLVTKHVTNSMKEVAAKNKKSLSSIIVKVHFAGL